MELFDGEEESNGGVQRNSDEVQEPSGQRMSDEEDESEEKEEEQVRGVGQSVRFFTQVNPSVKQI